MSDYQQQEGTATTWRRASNIVINNPLNGIPTIWFQEDDVVTINDKSFVSNGVSNLHAVFDSAAEIPLINPLNGEALGSSVSQGELQVILYSLYIQKAVERDTPVVVTTPVVTMPTDTTDTTTEPTQDAPAVADPVDTSGDDTTTEPTTPTEPAPAPPTGDITTDDSSAS